MSYDENREKCPRCGEPMHLPGEPVGHVCVDNRPSWRQALEKALELWPSEPTVTGDQLNCIQFALAEIATLEAQVADFEVHHHDCQDGAYQAKLDRENSRRIIQELETQLAARDKRIEELEARTKSGLLILELDKNTSTPAQPQGSLSEGGE